MTPAMADNLLCRFDPADVSLLDGIFAPTYDERDDAELAVTQGDVPRDLVGAYLRNGPNARFNPNGSSTARRHRYMYVVGSRAPTLGEWDQLRRYDTVTGHTVTRHAAPHRLGEAIFIPGT